MPSPAVPSIPPLSSITDPNTRAVLQAIVDGQRIRNGDIGDGDEKFLTVADLKNGINGTNGTNGSGGGGAFGSASKGEKSVAAMIKSVSDNIMQSRIWKLLEEPITRIETPEWFLGKFGGAIRTEQIIREEQNSALAKQITTAVTNINDNVALVQTELKATSDLAGATASATTQIQTKVGEVDAAAKEALELAASVDGTVKGTWAVKFDLNGYVAGIGLGVDQKEGSPPKSNFVIRADTFAVGAPGTNDIVPFSVLSSPDSDGNPVGVYINTAYIKNAAIDTLKVGGNAITVPLSYGFYANTAGAGAYQDVVSIYISNTSNVYMAIQGMFSARVGYGGGLRTTGYRVTKNGAVIVDFGTSSGAATDLPGLQFADGLWPGQGATYAVQFYGQDSGVAMGYRSMTLLGVKR